MFFVVIKYNQAFPLCLITPQEDTQPKVGCGEREKYDETTDVEFYKPRQVK